MEATGSHMVGLLCRRGTHQAKTVGQKQGDQETPVLWALAAWAKVAGRHRVHGAAHSGGLQVADMLILVSLDLSGALMIFLARAVLE